MLSRKGKKCQATEKRHRVMIQNKVSTSDGVGGFSSGSWVDVGLMWCAIYPVKAAQLFEYRSINVEATHIVKIDGLEDRVNEVMRLLYNNRIFEILTIENLQERNFVKVIQCKEISVSGDSV